MKTPKRIKLNTSVAENTPAGLERIAKRERLKDHRGIPSKSRAIDWLVHQDKKAVDISSRYDL